MSIKTMNLLKDLSALYGLGQLPGIPLACIDTGFSCTDAGLPLIHAYAAPEKSLEARLLAEERYGFLPLPQIIRHTILGAHDFGGDVRLPSGPYDQAMKVVSCPVSDEESAWQLKMPDPGKAGGIPTAMEFSRLQHEKGLIVWFHHRSPFTMAANMCGMERFARWMYRSPDLCRHLIKMALDHVINVLDYWINTFGNENIAVYNSSPMESNQMISPLHFKEFALPAHEKYNNMLKSLGITRYFFHICGDQIRNLPYISEISTWNHPAVISIGHETGIQEAGKFFPNDIIYGNIDPRAIQSGPPKLIYEQCKNAIEKGKALESGFILAPGCDMPLFTTPENIEAMVRAVKDFG